MHFGLKLYSLFGKPYEECSVSEHQELICSQCASVLSFVAWGF